MLKIVWIPKEYKGFSFKGIAEEAKLLLSDAKDCERISKKIFVDSMILQNSIANLTEEEARSNLEILVPWAEKYLQDFSLGGKQ